MSTFAVGDIQGCYEQLRRLLDSVSFDPKKDTLWVVGDLVNRGPQSLETLRYIRGLGDRAVTVLGNHDLNLLAVSEGLRKPHRGDTVDVILGASDRDEVLHWLRTRKIMHVGSGYAMVHAGLLPQWTVAHALELAGELEAALRGPDYVALLKNMYGNAPVAWDERLTGYERLRVIVNAFTRVRLCDAGGTMEFSHKEGLAKLPPGYMPWFDVPGRASAGTPIVCGHWASLGLYVREDIVSIDSGCVWGRELTLVRLEDRRVFQCGCGELEGNAE